MHTKTKNLFETIFQEADVIDFDFSEWDRRVRLVVFGGLLEENFDGGEILHNVDFRDVHTISWKSNHIGVQLHSSRHHCQWVIHEFNVVNKGEVMVVSLSPGVGPAPLLEITCQDIAISELKWEVVNTVNPGWDQPYQPLARPGFEDLVKRLRNGEGAGDY